jgi:hypothetical protein
MLRDVLSTGPGSGSCESSTADTTTQVLLDAYQRIDLIT